MKVKFSRCNSSDLASLPLVDGQLTYVKDTGDNYLDVGTTRNKITDIVFLDNDEALEQIENPLSSKFYYVKSSKKLMYYNGTDYDTLNEVDVSAEDVHFTSTTGITATNVQDAFEQIETKVNSNTTNIASAQTAIQENANNISTIQQQVSSIIIKNDTQDETLGQLQTNITSIQGEIQDLKDSVPTDESFTELTNRVSAVEAKNTTQDTNIKDLQDKDKSQDTLISGLQSSVGTLQSDLDTAEENISTIQGDITDIKEKDSTQDTSIQTLKTSVGNVESDVTKVKGDISTLQATTGQHTTDITGLKKDVSTIKDTVETLNTSVGTNTSDISSLKTRVTTNENDIDTLQSSIEGINTNIISIEGNIDTVEGSVSTLQQTVSGHTTDITDLKSKVQKNTTNITSLQGNVGTLQGDLDTVEEDVSTLQTSVSGLQSSVSTNTQNIATNTQSIESIQEAMASTQHFRGYYQTIAEITKLEGHTGDFAYCAEDEFKYVYNGEQWVKTDEAVPDQTVEKTTILPLMNGTATIGTDNRYAAGNHVHPTDTTRASVEALEAHTTNNSNPHNVTKTQIGLGNVDNTSDLNKPISTATQTALNNKVDKVEGKGLSTEDYTTAEKQKLAGLSNYNDTEVKADITELQSNVGTLQSDVSTAKENISTLQEDVTGIEGNVSTLTQSVSTLDTTVDGLNTTVEGLETDVTELQGTVSDVEGSVSTLQTNLNNKVDKVQGKGLSTNDFTNAYKTKLDGLNNYDDTTVKQDITELQTDVNALETTVGNHTKSIETNTTDITTLKGNVQTLQTNLGNKVDKVTGKGLSTNDYTTTEKNKLAGIEANANNYTLPKASGTVLGGIKIGNNLKIDENGVVSATDTNTTYTTMKGATSSTAGTSGLVPAPQQGQQNSFLKGDGTWGTVESATYGEATQDQSGLMSASDKTKLDNIEANANNYTLPVATTTRLGGVKAGNNITISRDGTISATDTNTTYDVMEGATSEANGQSGLVPAPTQGQQTRFLRGDGTWQVPTNTTYTNATQSKDGLMSSEDKTKLDGIAENANNYVHPTTPGNKHIPSGGSTGQVLKWSANGTAVWGTDNDTTYTDATTSKAGLMSATDKTKLDSLQNFDDSTIQENIGDLQSSVSTLENSVSTIEESLDNKVDKVSGKQLSTNDYTTTEKNKLSGIATGATKVEKSNTNGNIKINGTETTVYTKPDLTKQEVVDALGYTPPTTNTTYSVMTGATSSQAGTSGLVPQPTAGKQTSFLRGDGTWVIPTNTTYTNATTEKDGLMSSQDKTKLDNIEAGDSTPLANGTASAGTSNAYAREDHRHPLQTTVSGNAGSATKLQTARTIGLSGAATGTATLFNGTANITIPVTSLDASKLTGTADIDITGNASTATSATTATTCTGNASTATKLQTPVTINGVEFDGSDDITIEVGSGGHTILNSSGSTMAARSKLRFNNADVTDDSENDTTNINITFNDIFANTTPVNIADLDFEVEKLSDLLNYPGFYTADYETEQTLNSNSGDFDEVNQSIGSSSNWTYVVLPIGNLAYTEHFIIASTTDVNHALVLLYSYNGTNWFNLDIMNNGNFVPSGMESESAGLNSSFLNNHYGVYGIYENLPDDLDEALLLHYKVAPSNLNLLFGIKNNNLVILGKNTTTNDWVTINIDTVQNAETANEAEVAAKLQTARTISLTGAVTGSTTFDGSADGTITTTLSNIDASKITSGTIDIARLPAAALERCVVVADDTARFDLTTSDVQLGDTVKVTDTNKMYMVTNTSELDNANGYTEFSAGHAATADTATKANQLTTARTINGTSFNGTANITTANWGTARNIGIVNSDGTGTAVTTSVNGSGNVNLKLPATIKASLTGNASTASILATARTIGLSGVTATAQSFNGSKNITIPITAVPASLLTGTASINTTGNAATADKADTATTATTATNANNVKYTLQNPTSSSTYVLPFVSSASTANKTAYINNGLSYNTLEGTTSATGYGTLILGNSTASGTATNKYGQIRLYGTSTGYTQLKAGSSTNNYTLTLPDATDTLVGLTTTQALTNKTYNGFTLAAACAKGVVTTVDTSANLPTSNAVKTFVEGKGYKTTDNNYYPTTWAWTNGTTSGPTATLTGSGMSAVSVAAIPAASGTTQSGIVTTGAQTFGGQKTFSSSPKLSTNTITTSSGYAVTIPNAISTLVNLSTSQALTNKTYNGLTLTENTSGFTIKGGSTTERTLTVNGNYTLGAACAKAVDTSITKSTTSTNLPTSAAVANLVKSVSGCTTQATSLTCTLPDNL